MFLADHSGVFRINLSTGVYQEAGVPLLGLGEHVQGLPLVT